MNKVRQKLTIVSGTLVMMTIFQGLVLDTIAPYWLVKYSSPLGAVLVFLCGLVVGQEWEEMEKGFFAISRIIIYGILLGILFSYLPIVFGVRFNYNSLTTFLIGRGFVALLLWIALGLAGVFTGSGTRI